VVFFKKRKKEKKITNELPKAPNKEDLMIEIEKAEKLLENVNENNKIEILNQLGKLYFEAGEIDQAINYYELSISENKTIGQANNELLKLYNIKRKEAIDQKRDSDVQLYLKKIDELLKLSKDIIRGKA
jgi:tetratricopeptide (TPR) repeat protein